MTRYFGALANEEDRFSLLGEVLYHLNSGSTGRVISVKLDERTLGVPYELTIQADDGRCIQDRAIYFRLHHRYPHFLWRNATPRRVGTLSLVSCQLFPDSASGSTMKYRSHSGALLDCYLYSLGYAKAPAMESPGFTSHFDECVQVILNPSETSIVSTALQKIGKLHLCGKGAPSHIFARIDEIREVGDAYPLRRTFVSLVAMRVSFGFFNKVRFTFPAEISELGDAEFLMFLMAWDKELTQADGGYDFSNVPPFREIEQPA